MHAGACSKRAEVRAAAAERLREQDPVHAAVEHGERRLPLLREQPLERRQHAVEHLAERLAAEEPRRLVAHLQRADEELLELVARDVAQPAAAPLGELGPRLRLAARRDDRRRLDRPRQGARHDQVEARRRRAPRAPPRPARARAPSGGRPPGRSRRRTRRRRAASDRAAAASAVASQRWTSSDAQAPARSPPLLILDRLESFLDEHGLGSGPIAATPDRRRRRLELHLPARARRRPVRAAPPAAPAAAAVGARHGARGAAAARARAAGLRALPRSSPSATTRACSACTSTSCASSTAT